MKIAMKLSVLFVFLAPCYAAAQEPPPWHDDLVDHMAGTWKMEGQVMGQDAHHDIEADWILNHQFMRIHEKTSASAPATEHAYEAFWYIGYDPATKRFVTHLMDTYGSTDPATLGYGARDGNAIRLVFDYADGPFHTTYRWMPEKDAWEWLLEQKDKSGKWTTFADLRLTRTAK